jgi:hypothetical protein
MVVYISELMCSVVYISEKGKKIVLTWGREV